MRPITERIAVACDAYRADHRARGITRREVDSTAMQAAIDALDALEAASAEPSKDDLSLYAMTLTEASDVLRRFSHRVSERNSRLGAKATQSANDLATLADRFDGCRVVDDESRDFDDRLNERRRRIEGLRAAGEVSA